jgi:DHA2 family multidrug resistance protein
LGGYLTDQFGWRMIFNINLPLGLLAAGLAWANIEDQVDSAAAKAARAKQKIDLLGLVLLVVGVGCIQYVLERGEADDWFASNTIIICSIISAACLPTFIWWELKVPNPIVKVSLFKLPLVRSGTLMMLVLGFFLYGLVFIIPVFVGRVLHYDATQTGTLFIPGALLTMFMMPFIGKMISKVDPRVLIFIGFALVEVCLFTLTQYTPQTDENQIFWSMLIRGAAMAFLFVPINTTVLSSFKGQDLGQVAGLMNLMRQIGGSIGIAMIATMLQRAGQQNYLDLTSKVSLLNPATQMTLKGTQFAMTNRLSDAIGTGNTYEAALKSLYYRIQNQAFVMSFTQIMWIIFIVALFVLIPLVTLEKPKAGAGPVDVH